MPPVRIAAKGNPFGKVIPARYVVSILGCIAMAIIYGLKVNLSVAIVTMVNHTAIGTTHLSNVTTTDCLEPIVNSTETTPEDGPFEWSRPLQGTILSSYFWGYIIAQLPGGRVAELFSSKWVMFFSVAINVICTMLTPIAAKLHYTLLLIMRIGEGIGGGVTFPAMHVMLAHWAPPTERSILSSICYAGTALGTVISMLLSGIIASAINWEAVFYIQGGVSLLWLLLWVWLIADRPEMQTLISEEEREYIILSLKTGERNKMNMSVPWKSVFTSKPFWAILIAHTCSNWGWYMLLIELPYYLKSALHFKINENAVLTALPFLCMWIFSISLSKILDMLRSRNVVTTTTARKIATGFASIVPMICLIVLCYIGCRRKTAVFFMTVAVMSYGGMFCGFLSNHIDIAPNFAGTLMAITNTIATIPGIIVPVFVGKLTENDAGIGTWSTIFWVTAGFFIVEIGVYMTFGSGEEQKWNRNFEDDQVETQQLKSPTTSIQERQRYDSTTQHNT